jgi:hypothetical protein
MTGQDLEQHAAEGIKRRQTNRIARMSTDGAAECRHAFFQSASRDVQDRGLMFTFT